MVAARPTNPVAVACAKNVPMPTSTRPTSTAESCGNSSSGRPAPASASAHQNVGLVPTRCTKWPATGVVKIEGRNTK